jgi:hypothetical protein
MTMVLFNRFSALTEVSLAFLFCTFVDVFAAFPLLFDPLAFSFEADVDVLAFVVNAP